MTKELRLVKKAEQRLREKWRKRRQVIRKEEKIKPTERSTGNP